MKTDTFWKSFWLLFGGLALLCFSTGIGLYAVHIKNADAAAVGVSYDPNKDPFESRMHSGNFSLVSGYVYRDSLPLGLDQWAWDSKVDWRSGEQVYEGLSAMKISFNKEWSGMGISGFSVSRATYQSLAIAVNPDASVGDIYVELYDGKGVSLGRQSVGWYATSTKLQSGTWQYLSIPLQNLMGSSTSKTITGISISTENPGVAYLDSIQFQTNAVAHAPWVQPQGVEGPPFNPFATSTPVSLPFQESFSPSDFSRWYSYYGDFSLADGEMLIGPKANLSNDSISVFRSGRAWSDYQITAEVGWGSTSLFSLLLRMQDASTYASCVFSYKGQEVQMYNVKDGASTLVGEESILLINRGQAKGSYVVGARIQGDIMECTVNGATVLRATVSGVAPQGTVGVEAWDSDSTQSPHKIRAFEVNPIAGE